MSRRRSGRDDLMSTQLRPGGLRQIPAPVAFLGSDGARNIAVQQIPVDGGLTRAG